MIIEWGHFALVLAFLLALCQTVFPLWGAARNRPAWMAVAVPAAVAGSIRVGDRAEVHRADRGAASIDGRVGAHCRADG